MPRLASPSPTTFLLAAFLLFNLYSQVLSTAALPEAPSEDLTAQLSALKGTIRFSRLSLHFLNLPDYFC